MTNIKHLLPDLRCRGAMYWSDVGVMLIMYCLFSIETGVDYLLPIHTIIILDDNDITNHRLFGWFGGANDIALPFHNIIFTIKRR